jgi:hypothetical protein
VVDLVVVDLVVVDLVVVDLVVVDLVVVDLVVVDLVVVGQGRGEAEGELAVALAEVSDLVGEIRNQDGNTRLQ